MLVDRLWRLRHLAQSADPDEEEVREAASRGPAGLRESVQQIAASPYLTRDRRADPRVVVRDGGRGVAVQGHCRRASIKDKNALTAFFGSFTFYTGLLSLALQWLLTSRLLRRFGLGVALSVVPVALALGSVGLLVSGSLAAAIMLRGSDQVLRYSIDRPAAELLYLPLPGGADAAGEVVHRHGGVAPGRRALGPGHPAAGHGPALAGGADRAG